MSTQRRYSLAIETPASSSRDGTASVNNPINAFLVSSSSASETSVPRSISLPNLRSINHCRRYSICDLDNLDNEIGYLKEFSKNKTFSNFQSPPQMFNKSYSYDSQGIMNNDKLASDNENHWFKNHRRRNSTAIKFTNPKIID